ncbi:MAG: caspase family protein, partial [Pseudomonadota bacterium]
MNRALRVWCTVLLSAALLAGPTTAADRGIAVTGPGALPYDTWGTYHALIIGINDYQQWPQLKTAVKDATVLSQVLVDRYGFGKNRVLLRTDAAATRNQITADIRALATDMKPTDPLLVYYAGHGQLEELTGDGYWIPVEGEANNPSSWISNSYLKAIFSSEKVTAKNVVVIADS